MSGSPEQWRQNMDYMQSEMERFLNHFHGSKPPPLYFSPRVWEPAADIYETAEAIIVLMELPGVRKDSIELLVDGSTLLVQGDRPEDSACSQGCYYQMEIQRGPCERRLQLPGPVDRERTEASYEDGILRVVLKKPAAQQPRHLHVHARE